MAEQGSVYATFIDSQVTAEAARRTALETRGGAILTTSSAFATFILAIAAVVQAANYKYSADAVPLILAVLVLFVMAGIAGLLANMLFQYQVPKPGTLEEMLKTGRWEDSETTARNRTSWLRLDTLTSMRKGNNIKATIIVIGHGLQLAAVVALTITVIQELT